VGATFRHEPEFNIIGGGLEVGGDLIRLWVTLLVDTEGKVSEDFSEVREDRE